MTQRYDNLHSKITGTPNTSRQPRQALFRDNTLNSAFIDQVPKVLRISDRPESHNRNAGFCGPLKVSFGSIRKHIGTTKAADPVVGFPGLVAGAAAHDR